MDLKCRLLKNLAEADEYLSCVSKKIKRKKKKKCEDNLKFEISDLLKCFGCNKDKCTKKDCH